MGDGVSQWRPPAAPSQPALRGGAGRYPAVYDPGGDDPPWRVEAAGPDPRQLHRDLRFCAYHRRILPGAGPAARIYEGRADHGYAAVGADDHCRSRRYCGGMAAQTAELSTEPISRQASDRLFAAPGRAQEADQVVRADAGLALHGAVPDPSQARLLCCPRSAWTRGRFHHLARNQPDVRRIARAVGGVGMEGDRFALGAAGDRTGARPRHHDGGCAARAAGVAAALSIAQRPSGRDQSGAAREAEIDAYGRAQYCLARAPRRCSRRSFGHSGQLVFGTAAEPTPRFEALLPPLVRAAPVGAVFEWRPDAEMMRTATRVRDQGGAALIIDYGHLRSEAGDTFQAIARHSFADPLKNPGEADITAHVDFQALARAAEDLGARVHGPVPQGDFLTRLGIETRALTLMAKTTPEISEDISGALKRLIGGGRGSMGSMFKVLAASEPNLTSLAGFADERQDARAEPS